VRGEGWGEGQLSPTSDDDEARDECGDGAEREDQREFRPCVADHEDRRGQHEDGVERDDDDGDAVDDRVRDGIAPARLMEHDQIEDRDHRLDGDEDAGDEAGGCPHSSCISPNTAPSSHDKFRVATTSYPDPP
jgi:hypothetical protein